MAESPEELKKGNVNRGTESNPRTDAMMQRPGETEGLGVSGERKSRNVGGFAIACMILVVLIVIGAIIYIVLRRGGGMQAGTPQPTKQSSTLTYTPQFHA